MAAGEVSEASADAWERRLNIRKRARADALAGAPAAGADELSAPERDVLAAVDAARRSIESERSVVARRAESELRRLAPPAPDVEGPIQAARLDLRQIKGRFAPDLTSLRAAAAQANEQLDGFRRANALRRPAIYPASAVLQAGLLGLAAAFEALFSAALFAETDERGLMGGAIIALGLSGANVSLGFLSGFIGLRYLGHARAPLKIAGAAALAIGFALSVALNLFAASWRNQLTAADTDFVASLNQAALFGLTSPQAVILLMLGAGVWMFSVLKGYSGFDDPYPDYGKLDRAARARADDLGEARDEAREAMEDAIDAARAQASRALDDARDALRPMRAAYDEAAGRVTELDLRLRRAFDSGAALIQLYRRENLAARKDEAPRYFAEAPPLAPPVEDALSGAADLMLSAQAALDAAQTRLGQLVNELGAELEAASAALEGAAPREAA